MIEPNHYMYCGCILPTNKLILDHRYGILLCPVHKKKTDYILRPCLRCGEILTVKNLKSIFLYCEDCDREIQNARVVYGQKNMSFIDPVLWHKEAEHVHDDMMTNIILGYDAIQINDPIEVQHQSQTIRIDFKAKLEGLQRRKPKGNRNEQNAA
jgi:hypothetical protein